MSHRLLSRAETAKACLPDRMGDIIAATDCGETAGFGRWAGSTLVDSGWQEGVLAQIRMTMG